jgi:L-asparagine transporter-like permease
MIHIAFYSALAGGLYLYAAVLNYFGVESERRNDSEKLHRRFRSLLAAFFLLLAALTALQFDKHPPREWWYFVINSALLTAVWVWITVTHRAMTRCTHKKREEV